MRKITLLFLLAFLGLSFNLNAQTDVVLNEDSIKEAKLLALPEISNVAKRIGNKLVISFQNGKITEFENVKNPEFFEEANGKKSISTMENPETGKIDTTFATSQYLLIENACAGKYFVLQNLISSEAAFAVTYEFLLINKETGKQHKLISNPIFSPDNNRFVELFLSMVDGGEPEIKVSSITKDEKILIEFDLKPTSWFIESIIWINNTEFKINRTNGEKSIAPFKYKFNGTKWVLATAQPAKKPAPVVKKPIKK